MSTSSSGSNVGIAAGVIGAIVTIVLYWVTLWLFGDGFQFFSQSGAWITIIISAFVTGYVGATIGR